MANRTGPGLLARVTRRLFLKGSGTVAAASTLRFRTAVAAQTAATSPPAIPRRQIRLTVNERLHELEVEDRWTLVEVLRDQLRLTGTKIGCDRGECGACTVIADDQPVYACSQLAVWMDGRRIRTVEGLADGDTLDPLQAAFIANDGPQCGFCTSGQLMSARALLDANPTPTRDEVRQGLTGNLCRCSNYNRYVDAVLSAADGSGQGASLSRAAASVVQVATDAGDPLQVIGFPVTRVDGRERVTGGATYTGDVQLPGMLYARVLRSPHPHARIRRIDDSAARGMPGVVAVLSRDNCDTIWSTGALNGRRYLFNNPVRFVGDPVAAVAAVDRHTAEAALSQIQVDYEPSPFVLDAEDAMASEAVEIEPGGNLAPRRDGVRGPEVYERGDVAAGLAASDLVVEGTYTSKHHNNAQMEPRVSVARWEGDRLTVWASTQGIANCRRDIARDLLLAESDVQVVCQFMGGGFGNKNQCHDFDLMAAILARETGQPVKLELSRQEDFLAVHGRWPTRQHYRVGVSNDGQLQAIELRGVSGLGGYRKSSGGIAGIELFRCPNVRREVFPVHTNMAVSGNYRGPAYPQGVWGIESVMDDVAHRLGIDPVAFHLTNLTRSYLDETPYTSFALAECIRLGAERFEWSRRWRRAGSARGASATGVGMAIGMFAARVGRSSARLRLDAERRLWVHVGVTDIGTAAKTTMAMIAAEAMGLRLGDVTVVWGDTDLCPFSVGESGSRTTVQTGQAIVEAAAQLEQQIRERGLPQGSDELVAEATPAPTLPGLARYSGAAHFVEVEVDAALGGVRVLRYLAVHDSGRIINPLTAVSQIKGGVVQGIGMALHEELVYDSPTGVPVNPGYYGARIMTHLDAPEVDVLFVEPSDAYGPYGAKNVGEPAIIPAVAAVGNAVFNAIGHRITELPITRDRVLEALA